MRLRVGQMAELGFQLYATPVAGCDSPCPLDHSRARYGSLTPLARRG